MTAMVEVTTTLPDAVVLGAIPPTNGYTVELTSLAVPGRDGSNLPPGGTPDYRVPFASSAAVSWADIFKVPAGLARFETPEQHGAPADNVGDDTAGGQTAIDNMWARGGGVVLLTAPYYRAKWKMRSGVVLMSLAGGQKQTGSGFACSVRLPSGGSGWMVDGVLEHTVVITGGATGGGYTLTGGYGGSATTATINLSDSMATVLSKVQALPGLSNTTMVAGGVATNYTLALGSDVGTVAYSGAITPGRLIATSSLTGGTPVITTKRLSVDGAGVHGIAFLGSMTSGSDPAQGCVRMRYSNKFRSDGLAANGTTLGSLVVGGGSATIMHANATNYAFSAPSQPTGTITTYGADHFITDCELGGIVYPTLPMIDTTNFYHCALAVMSTTTTVVGGIAEFGDCDIYVAGSYGRYLGARCDMSGGHGVYEVSYVYGNQFSNTLLLSPSTAADNTYDGMNLNGIGHTVDGVTIGVAVNSASTARCRYVVNDNDASASSFALARNFNSTFRAIGGDVNAWQTGRFFSIVGRPCDEFGRGNPAARPSARTGTEWYDTISGVPTVADGTYWRNYTGAIVGNVLPESSSSFRAAIDYQPNAGLAVNPPVRADGHADFGAPWEAQAVANAAAVSGGSVSVTNTGAGTRFPVVVGSAYRVLLHGIGPAGRSGATVSFKITWKDAGGTSLSTTTATTPVALGTTDTLAAANIPVVAPASSATGILTIFFTCTGLTAGDVFKFANVTVAPGTAATDVWVV